MKLTCEKCIGLCCKNTPEIRVNESNKIRKLGVENFVKIKVDDSKYAIVTKTKDNNLLQGKACIFLNEHGKCSIYEDRFEACKLFKCKYLDESIDKIDIIDFLQRKERSTENAEVLFSSDDPILEKLDEITIDEHMKNSAVDILTYFNLVVQIIENHKKGV